MPPIELEDFFLVQTLLDEPDSDDLVAQCEQSLATVDVIDPVSDSFATLTLNEDGRQAKHGDEVDNCQEIHRTADILHLMLLYFLNRITEVLESKGFMFSVNESFPDPNGKDDIVPALDLDFMFFVVSRLGEEVCHRFRVLWVLLVFKLLPHLVELFEPLLVFLLIECVLDVFDRFVLVEHAHEHLQVSIRDVVTGNVKLFQLRVATGEHRANHL